MSSVTRLIFGPLARVDLAMRLRPDSVAREVAEAICTLPEPPSPVVTATAWARVLGLAEEPSIADFAAAAAGCALVETRDALVMWVAPVQRLESPAREAMAAVLPEPVPWAPCREDRERLFRRLLTLCQHLPEGCGAAAATVGAFALWHLGEAHGAALLVDRALSDDPTYRLAQTLSVMLVFGIRAEDLHSREGQQ